MGWGKVEGYQAMFFYNCQSVGLSSEVKSLSVTLISATSHSAPEVHSRTLCLSLTWTDSHVINELSAH